MGLSEDMFGQVAISPYNELIAYEFLYSRKGASLKRIVEETVAAQKLPSEVFYERFGMVTPDDLAAVRRNKARLVFGSNQQYPFLAG